MPPKKSKRVKQLIPLEDIDTSALNLQQLQEFCVRVDGEIGKVEIENRGLEIEKNKVKMLADIANHQLNEGKSRLRWAENELEREREQFILKMLETDNNVRNVRVEKAKECNGKMEETFTKLQSITKSSVESCKELIKDVIDLNNDLRNVQVEQLNKVTKLNVEHDENRSKLSEKDCDLRRVSVLHQKNRKREVIKDVLDKCGKELERSTKVKDNIIKQVMKQHDKDTLSTRRYYEKILDVNRAVLEDLHDKHKTMKGNLTAYRTQITTLRADVKQAEKEINANRDRRKTMTVKMADSEFNKEELSAVRGDYMRMKEKLVELKADNMVLDEMLAIGEKSARQEMIPAEEELTRVQLNLVEQMTFLEQLFDRLRDHVTKLGQLIDFAKAKREYAGRRMSCEQSTRVALQSLADEAELELTKLRKISVVQHNKS